ncbi:MAG: hypoxanthine phosphoribosyltransferase [Clostridia bacterium]|nr:hypoxanthine phosphoribosyltransferase [Clostridia bacterium]
MMQDIEKVLISEEELQAKIRELGAILAEEYEDKNPIFLGVLKGVILFFSDMIRAIPIKCQMDLIAVSSYGSGTTSSGKITMEKDLSLDIEGRHVVILEDIIDSGNTLSHTIEYLKSKNPASLKICTLLDKPSRRKVELTADYTGFTVPDEFVVGYGLDYAEYYRNLPYVGILKRSVYEK